MQNNESGVDMGFDVTALMEGGLDFDVDPSVFETALGTIKSKPIIGSPQTEVKHVPVKTRTQLRQSLQRQQLIEEQRRKQDQNRLNTEARQAQNQGSNAIQMPGGTSSVQPIAAINTPKSVLTHPTRYHLQEKAREQYVAHVTMGKTSAAAAHSMPTPPPTSASFLSQPQHAHSSSHLGGTGLGADPPASPLSMQSSMSESNDLLEDLSGICNLDSVDPSNDTFLQDLEQNFEQHISHTLPQAQGFVDHGYGGEVSPIIVATKSSKSCPETQNRSHHGGRQRQGPPAMFMSEEEKKNWEKERQKKDNHNVIERRRRFNINDRIKELATLMPRSSDPSHSPVYRDTRQCKGSILTQSVSYIRKLQKDQARAKQIEDENAQLAQTNRKLLLKVQEMELMMQQHGLNSSPNGTADSGTADLFREVLRQPRGVVQHQHPQHQVEEVKEEPFDFDSARQSVSSLNDEMMDDHNPMIEDPMLSSSSPNVIVEHAPITVSMDDMNDMLFSS